MHGLARAYQDSEEFDKAIAASRMPADVTKVAQKELKRLGRMNDGTGEASEAFKANLSKNVLFPKRLGTSDEFASLALELLSNSYLNAETIRVDGGIRMPPK